MKTIIPFCLTLIILIGSAGVSENAFSGVADDCGEMQSSYKIDSDGNYTLRKTSEDYATALRKFKPLAEQGDAMESLLIRRW